MGTGGGLRLSATANWEYDLKDLVLDIKRKNDRIIQLLILVIVLQVAFLIVAFVP